MGYRIVMFLLALQNAPCLTVAICIHTLYWLSNSYCYRIERCILSETKCRSFLYYDVVGQRAAKFCPLPGQTFSNKQRNSTIHPRLKFRDHTSTSSLQKMRTSIFEQNMRVSFVEKGMEPYDYEMQTFKAYEEYPTVEFTIDLQNAPIVPFSIISHILCLSSNDKSSKEKGSI